MKIIDRATGKRVVDENLKHIATLSKTEPLKVNAEKGLEQEENSPMDPPSAYEKAFTADGQELQLQSAAIHQLVDDHRALSLVVDEFEKALMQFVTGKYFITKEINESFNKFFVFFDEHIIPHNKKEERFLFPILHQKLLESGEHAPNDTKTTAIDLMEDDHIKFIQLASLIFNLLGLGMRLPDAASRAMTFDIAYHNGKELVELLKLHVFREDHTLFPLAEKLLSANELEQINSNMQHG